MNFHSTVIASLVCVSSLMGAQAAHAAAPAGQITQLQGFVMAVKPGGALKLLSSQSVVEVGDTLMSEQGSFVRVDLADGRQAVLGPQTRMQVTSANQLDLREGQLRVLAGDKPNASPLTVNAGGNAIDAGTGSFDLQFLPDPTTAVALSGPAATRARLATMGAAAAPAQPASPGVQVAQGVPTVRPPTSPNLAPGLHVFVLDGAIVMSNRGGSQNFSAGQFGYTATPIQAPVIVPRNPALQFTPPPAFSQSTGTPASGGAPKSNAVDCEVR